MEIKRLIDALYDVRNDVYPYIAFLLDSRDRQIGLWYSSLGTVGVAVDSAQRLVSITTDQPWVRMIEECFAVLNPKKNCINLMGELAHAI
jgi:hypothetical protein